MTCLLVDETIVAFSTINKNIDLLTKKLSIVILQLASEIDIINALLRVKTAKRIILMQINIAVFAFASILRQLQKAKNLSLLDELLFLSSSKFTLE